VHICRVRQHCCKTAADHQARRLPTPCRHHCAHRAAIHCQAAVLFGRWRRAKHVVPSYANAIPLPHRGKRYPENAEVDLANDNRGQCLVFVYQRSSFHETSQTPRCQRQRSCRAQRYLGSLRRDGQGRIWCIGPALRSFRRR
jgi:hypothetical protein